MLRATPNPQTTARMEDPTYPILTLALAARSVAKGQCPAVLLHAEYIAADPLPRPGSAH